MPEKENSKMTDETVLKTMTLSDDEQNPIVSLCPGHVDAATFNKAFGAEGWSGGGELHDSELKHEYWRKSGKHGGWKKTTAADPESKPFTVSGW